MNRKTATAICSEVAKLLKQERLRKKMSMNGVAIRSGLSYQMISYVEREMRIPRLDTLLRISSALDLNLGDLILSGERVVRESLK